MAEKRMIDADVLLEWVSDAENNTRYYGLEETLSYSTLRNRIFDIITSEATYEESLVVESDNDDLKTHDLKISTNYLDQILNHGKHCEIRKNDRGFQVGDILVLKEWSKDGGFSGKSITRQVTHIETYNQKDGYVVLSIAEIKK